MTAALFVVGPAALAGVRAGGEFVLDGAEGRHAAAALRIRAGEQIEVADGCGTVASCRVAVAERDRLQVVVEGITTVPQPRPRLVLVQALAKGGRDEAAVETATEYGVDAVIPWHAERCVVHWSGDREQRAHRRWQSTALAAAKQSRRAWVPTIEQVVSTRALAARSGAQNPLLVLHAGAQLALTAAPLPDLATAVLLAVGPEGGISDRELAELTMAGAIPVRLGAQVLRASSAGPAGLAVLSVRLGRW